MKALKKNPRGSGYFYIFLTSLVCLLNVMDIERVHDEKIMYVYLNFINNVLLFGVIDSSALGFC